MKMVYEYICFIKVVKTYHELKLVICFLIRLKKQTCLNVGYLTSLQCNFKITQL